MDRTIVYPGQIPLETDLLSAQRSAMVALGYLAQATVGNTTMVDGLACSAAAGSLGVVVGPGAIFQLATADQDAFSSLAADADPLVKMGINTSSTTFALTAPTIPGQTISYLLEAAFLESDDTATVLPYFNAAAPAQPFSGPGGAGGSQPTRRRQSVQLQLKAGVAANTGTQALPAVDAGWVGLYRLDTNYGATSAAISVLPGAPFIGAKLPTVNAEVTALQSGLSALQAKEASDFASAEAAAAAVRPGTSAFVVLNASPGVSVFTAPWTGTYRVTVTGAGGGGGGSTSSSAGGGGGGGGTAISYLALTAGQQVQYVVGGGGAGGGADGSAGGVGGSSSFGYYLAASGGGGGAGGQNVGAGAGALPGVGIAGQNVLALLLYGGAGTDAGPSGSSGGVGGGSYWGGGARGATDSTGATNALALGSGGGGAYGSTAHTGGGGGSGLVLVEG